MVLPFASENGCNFLINKNRKKSQITRPIVFSLVVVFILEQTTYQQKIHDGEFFYGSRTRLNNQQRFVLVDAQKKQ